MNQAVLDQVTVIVVSYNSSHCFDGLDPLLTACPAVIVSDNGSGDHSADLARARWPHARVLQHGRNLGFGAANNRALRQVETPYALLLNPDCELSISALTALLGAIDGDSDAAIVAPQLIDARGRPVVNYRWPSLLWSSFGPPATAPTCVGFLCGAVMLLRLSRFQETGFFDEDFFLYFEDDDLCLRLFQTRRPMVLHPEIRVYHRSRGSVRGPHPWRDEFTRGYHHIQSRLLFQQKHGDLNSLPAKRLKLLVQTALALPFRALALSPRRLARMLGRFQGLRDWPNRKGCGDQ